VDGDGAVEISLASPHLYGDGETLDDLVGALTDDVEAHNTFFGTLDDELEGCGLLVVFLDHAEVEGLEGSFVWGQASLNMVFLQREKKTEMTYKSSQHPRTSFEPLARSGLRFPPEDGCRRT